MAPNTFIDAVPPSRSESADKSQRCVANVLENTEIGTTGRTQDVKQGSGSGSSRQRQSRRSLCIVAEDLAAHEVWRESETARRTLGKAGKEALKEALVEDYEVVPRSYSNGKMGMCGHDFPVLRISPAELFRHIIVSFESGRWSKDTPEPNKKGVFVELFGGVAQSVCLADLKSAEKHEMGRVGSSSNRHSEPTDLDARFYVSNSSSFDSCRAIVEDYLHHTFLQALSPDSPLRKLIVQPEMLRFVYFQKQAVVQEAFSLLSIGDAATGRNIDMEFALLGNGVRKYFDEANACVIPLTLDQLAGTGKIHAFSQTGNMNEMLALMRSRVLCVTSPEEVVNGLTLYSHAICDKGQWPSDTFEEQHLGGAFVSSLMQQSNDLIERRQDPIRFVRSFLRSHYTQRPLQALATLSQMLVEISAVEESAKDAKVRSIVCEQLAHLVADCIVTSLHAQPTPTDLAEMLRVVRFLVQPCEAQSNGEDGSEDGCVHAMSPSSRVQVVASPGGHATYVLRKASTVDTLRVCCMVASKLRMVERSRQRWVGCVLESVISVLQSHEDGGFGESESLGHVLKALQTGGECSMACALFVGKRGVCRMMTRDHTLVVAQSLLEDCPADRAVALAGLIVKSCSEGQMHQTAKEAIKRLRARHALVTAKREKEAKVLAAQLDAAILKLLMKIPQKPAIKRPAERSPPHDANNELECELLPCIQVRESGSCGRSKRIAFMGPDIVAIPERISGPERGRTPKRGSSPEVQSSCSDSTCSSSASSEQYCDSVCGSADNTSTCSTVSTH